jgi:hypothetical protein
MNSKCPRVDRLETGNRGVNPLCVEEAFGRFHVPPEFWFASVTPFQRDA